MLTLTDIHFEIQIIKSFRYHVAVGVTDIFKNLLFYHQNKSRLQGEKLKEPTEKKTEKKTKDKYFEGGEWVQPKAILLSKKKRKIKKNVETSRLRENKENSCL